MEEDSRNVCFEQKLRFVGDIFLRISALLQSHDLAFKKEDVDLRGLPIEMIQKGRSIAKKKYKTDKPTFSDYNRWAREFLTSHNIGNVLDLDFYADVREGAKEKDLSKFKRECYAFSEFKFSDDIYTFFKEFLGVLIGFLVLGNDQRADLGLIKAIFHAGKMTERLTHEGQLRSDRPAKAGSTPKKNRYNDQAIIEAFYKCNGKNPHAMALEIESFLDSHKKGHKTKKDVPSISTIKRVLIKEGLDKKLTM